MPEPSPPSGVSVYRLALPVAVRMLGAGLLLLTPLMVAATVLLWLIDQPGSSIVLAFVIGIVALGLLWLVLRRVAYVLRLDDAGYRVGLVRGAGVRRAGWREVSSAATTTVDGVPHVVLRLAGERRTTLPVSVMDVDREALVRELQHRLQRGHGIRSLDRDPNPDS